MMLLATVGYANTNLNDVSLDYNKWSSILIKLSEMKISNTLPIDLRIAPTGESNYPWELYLPLKEHNKLEYLDLWLSRDTKEPVEQDEFGCAAGKEYFAIDGYGDVYGCSLMVSERKLKAGSILDSSLNDIWYNSDIFHTFRNLKLKEVKGKCVDCENLNLCKAGCRVSAFSLTGDITGSDIRCPITKR
jgi:radical SAM protein with 4Fe4S-binding SPASM domain